MEEMDIPGLLARLETYRLGAIERVLAAQNGAVQLLLSLYFGSPVDVVLAEQTEAGGQIRRRARLMVRGAGQEACLARSIIPLAANRPEVLDDVREGLLGLGQIVVKHRIPVQRQVKGIKVTGSQIARRDVMQGPGLHFAVTEVYPRELYR